MFRVHPASRRSADVNTTGTGNTRFAPIVGTGHLYLADTRTTALLETVFHDVHANLSRVVYSATDLVARSLSSVTIARRTPVIDLRDPALAHLGLARNELVATTPAHYACTRQWSLRLVARRFGRTQPVGIVWNSRIAELAGRDSTLLADVLAREPSEVVVLFRPPADATLLGSALLEHANLSIGQGRLLVDEIAELLDAEVH